MAQLVQCLNILELSLITYLCFVPITSLNWATIFIKGFPGNWWTEKLISQWRRWLSTLPGYINHYFILIISVLATKRKRCKKSQEFSGPKWIQSNKALRTDFLFKINLFMEKLAPSLRLENNLKSFYLKIYNVFNIFL